MSILAGKERVVSQTNRTGFYCLQEAPGKSPHTDKGEEEKKPLEGKELDGGGNANHDKAAIVLVRRRPSSNIDRWIGGDVSAPPRRRRRWRARLLPDKSQGGAAEAVLGIDPATGSLGIETEAAAAGPGLDFAVEEAGVGAGGGVVLLRLKEEEERRELALIDFESIVGDEEGECEKGASQGFLCHLERALRRRGAGRRA